MFSPCGCQGSREQRQHVSVQVPDFVREKASRAKKAPDPVTGATNKAIARPVPGCYKRGINKNTKYPLQKQESSDSHPNICLHATPILLA